MIQNLNNILKTAFLLVLFLSMTDLSAQQYIYLQKKGNVPYKRLTLYDDLKILPKDSDDWIKGKINFIAQESLEINGTRILYSDIQKLKTYSSTLKLTGAALGIAGGGYAFLSTFNSAINGESTLIYSNEVITSSILLAGGLIMYFSSGKTYDIDKGWELRIIDTETYGQE